MTTHALLFSLVTVQLAVSASAAPADLPPALTRSPLRNPQMTDGTNQPEHWTQTWVGRGKIKVTRDTATYHSAPASHSASLVHSAAVQRPQHAAMQSVPGGASGQHDRHSDVSHASPAAQSSSAMHAS